MGRTAEDMVRAGELDAEGDLGATKGADGQLRAACPCCDARKPLFALEHHARLGLSCDWCRLDAERKDQPPSDDELWSHVEQERRSRLNESAWAAAQDGTVDEAEALAWGAYRRAVAAIRRVAGQDPRKIVWPDRPLSSIIP